MRTQPASAQTEKNILKIKIFVSAWTRRASARIHSCVRADTTSVRRKKIKNKKYLFILFCVRADGTSVHVDGTFIIIIIIIILFYFNSFLRLRGRSYGSTWTRPASAPVGPRLCGRTLRPRRGARVQADAPRINTL
jgi:hypothetical protein